MISRRAGRTALLAMWATLGFTSTAVAQSPVITGQVVDQQARPVAGATVTLANPRTGFTRRDTTDADGLYRLAGMPAGIYNITAALAGFTSVEQRDAIADVGSTTQLDLTLRIAAREETITVIATNPLVSTASAVVGGVVDTRRIEELPLNGRQFANLAATLPGVGIAFHRDPTKGTQYSPQVGGGSGRNVNYLVDGGDNNDDTVGGQLQQFPLDTIEEFVFSIASYSAQHGRGSGGVMNVVTRSGTNVLAGSAFAFLRDDALNARTVTESAVGVPRQDYRRWQYGGSAGGPLKKNKAHFFGAIERVRQQTFQAVDTKGLFPALDGVFPVAYRETLATGKLSLNLRDADHVWVRYAANLAGQPVGVASTVPPSTWGESRNRFHSLNASYTRILGGAALNELTTQYATFLNAITSNSTAPIEVFPNGVIVGRAPQSPQSTVQRKVFARDDVSLLISGRGGLGHGLKIGVAVAHDLRLGIPSSVEAPGAAFYTHATNDRLGPISSVSANLQTTPLVFNAVDFPLTQIGGYVQDDWRLTNRLTVNAGVRYDVTLGYQIDQAKNPNFVVLQNAARAGRFAGVIGMEDFGREPRNDDDNVQPRFGFALDLTGRGRDVLRGGWGIYTDIGYTNSNILFAAFDAQGVVATGQFMASDPNGLRKADGNFFHVGDPLSTIAGLNEGGIIGLGGEVVSPRLQQPYARQASVGWSHQVGAAAAFSADVIHSDGRNLNVRARLNARIDGGARQFADLPLDPNGATFRVAISPLRSVYDALLLSLRRRSASGLDVAFSYALSRAKSELGQAMDETGLGPNTIQNVLDPFAPVQYGPATSDARHLLAISAIVPLGWGVQASPLFSYRSALPVFLIEGLDRNRDGVNNDIPDRAYQFDGVGRTPRDIGACTVINCGRGAGASHLNLRVLRRFALRGNSRVDVIAEVFNLFNASNPSAFNARRLLGTAQNPLPNPDFLQPVSFSGDFQRPEQRVGQVALKWRF